MQTTLFDSEQTLEFDPEELKRMSQLLAETLLGQFKAEEFTSITCVYGYEIIREDQIAEVIQLDLISSTTAGVLDPLGQLQEWFTSLINSIAGWIVSSIESFIEAYVLPAIDAIISNVWNFIYIYVLPAINAVTDFINTYVLPAIDAVVLTLTDAINALSIAITDALSSAVLTLTDAIGGVTSAIMGALSTAVATLTDAISGVATAIRMLFLELHQPLSLPSAMSQPPF